MVFYPGSIELFPARSFFRALSRVISAPCQRELPLDNRWKFRRRFEEAFVAELSGLLRDVGGVDDLLLFDRAVDNRLVA